MIAGETTATKAVLIYLAMLQWSPGVIAGETALAASDLQLRG